VIRLGENLPFGYFLLEYFCTNEQLKIWFVVCILTFSTHWTEISVLDFLFLAKVLATFPEIGGFSFQSCGHSVVVMLNFVMLIVATIL
jgi:hypothetical protein